VSNFNWQKNILIKREEQVEVPIMFGAVIHEWVYLERAEGWNTYHLDPWYENELLSDLSKLPDEELKAAMFHQPLLAELIAGILKQRDNTTRRRIYMKKLMTALGLTLLVVAICYGAFALFWHLLALT
jgi:hypothetical protein